MEEDILNISKNGRRPPPQDEHIRESDLFKVLMLKTRFNKTGTLFTIN